MAELEETNSFKSVKQPHPKLWWVVLWHTSEKSVTSNPVTTPYPLTTAIPNVCSSQVKRTLIVMQICH